LPFPSPAQQEKLLFTDLNALTEEQIEAGLAAGVWRENRPFVEQYLDQIRLSRSDAAVAAQGLEAMRSIMDHARAADFRATIALIVAAGAMLAAMAAAFIAFMALRGMTISW
jgi:tetrahydrodipicolinate N-succinyltransferase